MKINDPKRRPIARAIASLDFGCGWSKGQCRAQVKGQEGQESWCSGPMACCKNCAGNFGYLPLMSRRERQAYEKLFDHAKGFWSSSGCRLPPEKRSDICLRYACGAEGIYKDFFYGAFAIIQDMLEGTYEAG